MKHICNVLLRTCTLHSNFRCIKESRFPHRSAAGVAFSSWNEQPENVTTAIATKPLLKVTMTMLDLCLHSIIRAYFHERTCMGVHKFMRAHAHAHAHAHANMHSTFRAKSILLAVQNHNGRVTRTILMRFSQSAVSVVLKGLRLFK